MVKRKLIQVDFQALESHNYASLDKLGKEIVDRFIELSSPSKSKISESTEAQIDLLMAAFGELTDRQKLIVTMLFGLDGLTPRTEREVAKELGIAKTSVHEAKERAFRAIRKKVIPTKKSSS